MGKGEKRVRNVDSVWFQLDVSGVRSIIFVLFMIGETIGKCYAIRRLCLYAVTVIIERVKKPVGIYDYRFENDNVIVKYIYVLQVLSKIFKYFLKHQRNNFLYCC